MKEKSIFVVLVLLLAVFLAQEASAQVCIRPVPAPPPAMRQAPPGLTKQLPPARVVKPVKVRPITGPHKYVQPKQTRLNFVPRNQQRPKFAQQQPVPPQPQPVPPAPPKPRPVETAKAPAQKPPPVQMASIPKPATPTPAKPAAPAAQTPNPATAKKPEPSAEVKTPEERKVRTQAFLFDKRNPEGVQDEMSRFRREGAGGKMIVAHPNDPTMEYEVEKPRFFVGHFAERKMIPNNGELESSNALRMPNSPGYTEKK